MSTPSSIGHPDLFVLIEVMIYSTKNLIPLNFSCHVWTGVFTGMCESKQKNTKRAMFDDCVL